MEFKVTEDFIPLIKLLKTLRIAESGGQAKMMVDDGIVLRNGEQEFRYRAKLVPGDVIEIPELIDQKIVII
ncbi:RNA-binding S4 domain-containing protein [Halosquirtibacter laminarini]|uniref:RNA-binding S4 domain-containing protein n=1 Tax=Halosquirtibacter laminarini TaxID=3374600 RepID=A0AC61NEX4_9BACT|nr:RNA-binding S4 domain-containing protein [Prolixibacteraceae bacterium]